MVQAAEIDLCAVREIFPRFSRLDDTELTHLLTHDIFGPNELMSQLFSDAHLIKNNEGHIAGMETPLGEQLIFDAPIEGKFEAVAHRVLASMQAAVRREIGTMVTTIKTANDYLQWAKSGKIQ